MVLDFNTYDNLVRIAKTIKIIPNSRDKYGLNAFHFLSALEIDSIVNAEADKIVDKENESSSSE